MKHVMVRRKAKGTGTYTLCTTLSSTHTPCWTRQSTGIMYSPQTYTNTTPRHRASLVGLYYPSCQSKSTTPLYESSHTFHVEQFSFYLSLTWRGGPKACSRVIFNPIELFRIKEGLSSTERNVLEACRVHTPRRHAQIVGPFGERRHAPLASLLPPFSFTISKLKPGLLLQFDDRRKWLVHLKDDIGSPPVCQTMMGAKITPKWI